MKINLDIKKISLVLGVILLIISIFIKPIINHIIKITKFQIDLENRLKNIENNIIVDRNDIDLIYKIIADMNKQGIIYKKYIKQEEY